MKKFLLLLGIIPCFIMCSDDDEGTATVPEPVQEDPMQEPPPPPANATFPAPCVDGLAAGTYDCNNIDLIYKFNLNQLDANSGNDCWGWTDPTNGREYALMGLDNGTAFIDISDPSAPVYLGKLPTETVSSSWRDIKVYKDHAFVVSEAAGHGMQVFDLTKLRSVTTPPATFNTDAVYTEFGKAHNIVINEATGFAYVVGTSTFDGGPHIINIQNPKNPEFVGGYSLGDYSHDAQVVVYAGPDAAYQGKELLIGSNANKIVIVDITDKVSPVEIATITYPQTGYTHQGWFTEDHRYFILGDETDELNFGLNSRTLVFDFSDLENPTLYSEYFGPTTAIDHNGYVHGNSYYMANYSAGLRILDINEGILQETAFFDSFPSNNNASFNGAWSVFPYFESGHIIISDIDSGFYLVKPKY
ncbi:MAG: regulator [Flavobacteriaceae bacterium]|nr:regulator [Flavobacteriaceae bacterium]